MTGARVCRHCGMPIEILEHTLNGADNLEWVHRAGQRYHVKCRGASTKAAP